MIIKFSKLDERIPNPDRKTHLSSGFDIVNYSYEPIVIEKFKTVMLRTGLIFEVPEGFEGQLRIRSGISFKGVLLLNGIGTIDADYRGEVKIPIIYLGNEDSIIIEPFERVAQMVFLAVSHDIVLCQVEEIELSKTLRGAGGLGHTGKF